MTESELEKLLKENLQLSKENHMMLKKIRRQQKLASFSKVVYWLVILFIMVGGYIFVVQPLVEKLDKAYTQINNTAQGIQGVGTTISNTGSDVGSFFGNIFGGKEE